jgi:hypothetical protein
LSKLGLGDALGKDELQALVTGGKGSDAVRKRLQGILEPSWGKEGTEELLGKLRGGLTADEMRKVGSRQVLSVHGEAMSEKVAKEAGLKDGLLKLTGKEGSPDEMGKQMKIQSTYQRGILELLQRNMGDGKGPLDLGKQKP